MQKKKVNLQESSAWEESLKKQQKKENLKKYGIWTVFGIIFLLGIGGLIKMAGTPGATPIATENPNLPKVTDQDIVVGDRNAKTSVIEYSDFQCPACASYNPVVNRLEDEFEGKVKFVYRFFPLTNIHKNAVISAQAAYAANKQGKFSEMKDALYDNQPSWENLPDPRSEFEKYAAKAGLNVDQFKRDMNSNEAKNAVIAGERSATSLGINSTPTFFINNKQIIPNGYEDFKRLLDQEVNK